MGFLEWLRGGPNWRDEPNNIAAYPLPVQDGINEIIEELESLVARDDEILKQLGVPLPEGISDFEFRPAVDELGNLETVEIIFPKYTFPSYFTYFPLLPPNRRNQSRSSDSPNDIIVATVLCEPEEYKKYEDAQRHPMFGVPRTRWWLAEWGSKRKTVWTNREIFTLYTRVGYAKVTINGYGNIVKTDHNYDYATKELKPLETKDPIPLDELKVIQERWLFITRLSQAADSKLNEDLFGIGKRQSSTSSLQPKQRDAIIYEYPIPNANIDKPIRLQLLPAKENQWRNFQPVLAALRGIKQPMIFELVLKSGSIQVYLCCDITDKSSIKRQIAAMLPSCTVLEQPIDEEEDRPSFVLLGDPDETEYFLRSAKNFSNDPYNHLLNIFDESTLDTAIRVQFFFQPCTDRDVDLVTHLQRCYMSPDFEVAEERLKAVEEKKPAWWFGIRGVSTSKDSLKKLKEYFFSQYKSEQEPLKLELREMSGAVLDSNLLNLVSLDELLGFVHLPDRGIMRDSVESTSMKAKLPPDLYTAAGAVMGESTARGVTKTVALPDSVRDRHCYIIGKSGTGKSTLLFNLAYQDILAGRGVGVIDPHGDLVDDLVNCIPPERIKDTIYFNAADRDYPIGLNVLNAQNEAEMSTIALDLFQTFQRLTGTGGPQMDAILKQSFNTLVRAKGVTILDLRRFLSKEEYRNKILAGIRLPIIREFWEDDYPRMAKLNAAQPILNRLTDFAMSEVVSGVLSQVDAKFNISTVMNGRKILLVKLPKDIGARNAELLGSLLVNQIQLAAMRRAALPREERIPFYLYIDEFQNFVNPDFESILAEARKYQLCLTLANQFISQIDEGVRKAIFGNVGTMIVFQVGKDDAATLRNEMGTFEQEDLINLDKDKHEVLCRPTTKAADTFLFVTNPPSQRGDSYAEDIIEYTRTHYSRPIVEEEEEVPRASNEPARAYQAPQSAASVDVRTLRPVAAPSKGFPSRKEAVLHYVGQAGYLTRGQLLRLCYSDGSLSTEGSRKNAVTRDLTSLQSENKLKVKKHGAENAYGISGRFEPRAHDVEVRELYTRIVLSGFEITDCKFDQPLSGIIADLAIAFEAEGGGKIPSFWEYDTGSEGMSVIEAKLRAYEKFAGSHYITFVASSRQRFEQLARTIHEPWVTLACVPEFERLQDAAFVTAGASTPLPFFATGS